MREGIKDCISESSENDRRIMKIFLNLFCSTRFHSNCSTVPPCRSTVPGPAFHVPRLTCKSLYWHPNLIHLGTRLRRGLKQTAARAWMAQNGLWGLGQAPSGFISSFDEVAPLTRTGGWLVTRHRACLKCQFLNCHVQSGDAWATKRKNTNNFIF